MAKTELKRMAGKALRAVKAHAVSMGTAAADFEHIPLHYSITDLVSGLMLLAKREGADFKAVLKDARELLEEEGTDFCAVHGTPVSLDETKPCKHCVRDFPTRLSERSK